MASLNTGEEEHLSILAVSKQDAAHKDFRPQLENITPQNCDATFAFSLQNTTFLPLQVPSSIPLPHLWRMNSSMPLWTGFVRTKGHQTFTSASVTGFRAALLLLFSGVMS